MRNALYSLNWDEGFTLHAFQKLYSSINLIIHVGRLLKKPKFLKVKFSFINFAARKLYDPGICQLQ